jgi:pSer/pThr/pTyr-binding forkhead associated (FHA) protein
MKLSLLVMTAGKLEGQVIEIKLPQFLIGRDQQCHLRPASALISKRHCALIQRDDKAFIRDFGSTNGTFVNDDRVEGERELKHDDQLKIGPIMFVVRLELTAAAARTPVPPTKSPTQVVKTPTPAPAVTAAPKSPVPPTKNTKSDTPAPPTQSKKPSAEDDIAAMLLSLEDGESSVSSGLGDPVPEGSTVFDIQVPPPGQGPAPKGDAKDDKAKTPGDTRSAAAKILEQMTKRPRNTT